MNNQTLRRFFRVAGMAAICGATAVTTLAHHEKSTEREYLAFWGAYRPASAAVPTPEACQDGLFWEKGFVSIYSQGGE